MKVEHTVEFTNEEIREVLLKAAQQKLGCCVEDIVVMSIAGTWSDRIGQSESRPLDEVSVRITFRSPDENLSPRPCD